MAPHPLVRGCAIFLFPMLLSSCVIPDDTSSIVSENSVTAAARTEMVGLSEADLRMCAGFPSEAVEMGEDGKILSYQRVVQRGNVNVVLPTSSFGILPSVGGSMNLAPNGYCHTQVRLVNGRVAEVAFAGNNNQPGSLNALCVSIVDGCLDYARKKRNMRPAPREDPPASEAR